MKKLFCVFLSAFLSLLFTLCVQAAEVTVYLNGSQMDFGRAEPEIKNSRVMLPFRDIAEAMGAEVTWDKETKQMCLLKNGRTVVHTLNQNYIYVNGEAKAYDTSSDEVNGRTRMPVVMLAESLGAKVSWDAETKSVYVSTTDSAKVITTMFDSNVVIDGETVTASVITTDATERIKLVDTLTGNVINESYSSADYGDGKKVFTISYTPSLTNASENTPVSIYAGDSTGYNEDAGTYYTGSILSILDTNPKIRSIVTSENSVDKNDYVTMKIYTNTAADRVRVESEFQSTRDQLTNFTEYGNERVFEYKVKMTQKGDFAFFIYPGSGEGYEPTYETVRIGVASSSTRKDKEDEATLTIRSVNVTTDNIAIGEMATVLVTTSSDISYVELYNSADARLDKVSHAKSKNDTDNKYTWELSFRVDEWGSAKYTVKAYNSSDESTKDTFYLTGEKYDDAELAILSVTQKDNDASVGETVKFSVKTTGAATMLEVYDVSGNIIETLHQQEASTSSKTWNFSVMVESETKRTFHVYAYDENKNSVNKKFIVDVDGSAEDPQIIEIDLEDSTVYEGDDIEVTIYTNDSVSKIRVEDSYGTRVATSSRHDRIEDEEFVWEIKFEAKDEGKMKYTVYARNQNDVSDTDTFSVRINTR